MKKVFLIIIGLFFLVLKNFGYNEPNTIFFEINAKNNENLLALSPIKFNFVLIGKVKTKYISITNAGANSIKFQKITLAKNEGNVFSFTSTLTPPTFIQPNEKISINLSFQPQTIDSFFDTLIIEFSEPFFFLYEVPIEGYSFLYNTLWIKDTSALIGTNELAVPIFLNGIPELEEAITCYLSFDLTFDNSVFNLNNESLLPIQSKTSNHTFSNYRFLFENVVLDQNQKILTNLIGKVLLGNNRETTFQLSNITTNLEGVYIIAKNGNLEALSTCLSDYSMIELNSAIPLDIYPNPAKYFIKIDFQKFNENFLPKAKIEIWNIYGLLVKEFEEEIADGFELDISYLPSGLYRFNIKVKNQQYSKQICVIK